MSDKTSLSVSRRGFMTGACASVVAVGAALIGREAEAKAPKGTVQYQGEPKNGNRCDGCQFWIEPKDGETMGACQIVAGEIAPEAWCNLWAAAS